MQDQVPRNALQAGFEIHWYRIEKVLGQGGFGITYLAKDTNLDQFVAIKEYLPVDLAMREGDLSVHPVSQKQSEHFHWGLERFIAEARTLAKFDHPNIVRVLSVFEANNTAYMVMRYEQGQSLDECIPRRGTLEQPELEKILFPILDGLRLVHEAGFIHRDIKPGNIFIRKDGSPVLLDFGSARQSLGDATKTLTTLVSPGYAPFEQYYSKSDRQGPWTDIYGLAATLYRCVVGVAPIDAVDRSEGFLKGDGIDTLIPALEAGKDRYTPQFLKSIDKALAFKQEDRPQSVDQWVAEFDGTFEVDAPAWFENETELDTEHKTVVAAHVTPVDADSADGPEMAATDGEINADDAPATRPDLAPITVYREFIGSRNTNYYLERFIAFDKRPFRRRLSWHWPASLFTMAWLAYRRLYLWAFVLHPLISFVLAAFVLLAVRVLFFADSQVPEVVVVVVAFVASFVWPGLLANAIYHWRAKRRVREISGSGMDEDASLKWLAQQGGTSRAALITTLIVLTVIFILIAAGESDAVTLLRHP